MRLPGGEIQSYTKGGQPNSFPSLNGSEAPILRKMQISSNNLSNFAVRFVMLFTPASCKLLPQE
ncbi:hypothetical protein T265_04957 [Opisthorchis viverrini]|uniref:Uncharacterized protein n=1 Tax=Opisthorchis viverrini TaxID=6198 RepID=A0A074ZL93_OPIVI|nr:hypothetical protein T265_04957 [Opisthorchis viverrini]KER28118.1 hypothetical protein T265_04957 [Opisthorchis viverrini]